MSSVTRNDTPTTLYGQDGSSGNAVAVDRYGRQYVIVSGNSGVTGATLSNVSATGASGTVLAANAARCGATIYNDSATTALIKFGSTASATSFTVSLSGSGYYEVPFGYTGIITAITGGGTATLRVTELTAV